VIPEIGPLETPLDAEIEAEKERRAKDEQEKAAAKAQKAEPTQVPANPAKEFTGQANQVRLESDTEIARLTKEYDDLQIERRALGKHGDALRAKYRSQGIAPGDGGANWFAIPEYDDYRKRGDAIRVKSTKLLEQRVKLKGAQDRIIRELLYVDSPSSFDVDLKSKFTGSDPRTAALNNGIDEFKNLVGSNVVPSDSVLQVRKGGRGRSSMGKIMNLTTTARERTVIHEMGHWLEDINPEIHDKAVAFLDRRTEGDPVVTMNQAIRDKFDRRGNYRSSEKTRPDEFRDPYIGKDYSFFRPTGKGYTEKNVYATEVVSMGLEYMYHDPVSFAREDPDMFNFIYRLVR
jgi:hypothetical protein